jgi:hypothetical protein
MQSPYKQELENFLLNYVVKSFNSPYPFLRAKACWVAGQYSDVRFSAGFGRGPNFNMILQHVITLMQDPELPVRFLAEHAQCFFFPFPFLGLTNLKPYAGPGCLGMRCLLCV